MLGKKVRLVMTSLTLPTPTFFFAKNVYCLHTQNLALLYCKKIMIFTTVKCIFVCLRKCHKKLQHFLLLLQMQQHKMFWWRYNKGFLVKYCAVVLQWYKGRILKWTFFVLCWCTVTTAYVTVHKSKRYYFFL